MSEKTHNIFSESTLNVYTAEYICGDGWWLDDTGRNWWSRKDFFPYNALYLTKVGCFDLTINDEKYRIPPHSLVFIPAGSRLEFSFDGKGPLEKYFVHFDLNYPSGSLAKLFTVPKLSAPKNEPRLEELFLELIKHRRDRDSAVSAIAVNATMTALVAELLMQTDSQFNRDQNALPKDMLDTVQRIEKRYCEQLSISEVAKKAGYSTTYFTKKFKKTFGCTPTEYIMNLRIERAKQLLKNSEMTVAEIASVLGFTESSHFSSFFKSKTGLSPAYYRRLPSHQASTNTI